MEMTEPNESNFTDNGKTRDGAIVTRRSESKPLWHCQPVIKPTYKKQQTSLFPKTHLKNVLLYENVNQKRFLECKLEAISEQQRWAEQLRSAEKRTFVIGQIIQQQQMKANGRERPSFLPRNLVEDYKHLVMTQNVFHMGLKQLPMSHRIDKVQLRAMQRKQLEEQDKRMAEAKKTKKTSGQAKVVQAKGPPHFPKIGVSVTAQPTDFPDGPLQSQSSTAEDGSKADLATSRPTSPGEILQENILEYQRHRRKKYRVQDQRFLGLERALLPSRAANDGYLQLSSSSWNGRKLTWEEMRIIHSKYMKIPIKTDNMLPLFNKLLHKSEMAQGISSEQIDPNCHAGDE